MSELENGFYWTETIEGAVSIVRVVVPWPEEWSFMSEAKNQSAAVLICGVEGPMPIRSFRLLRKIDVPALADIKSKKPS
jgi:hypothetical protein